MLSPEAAAARVLQKIGWDGNIPIDPRRVAACYDVKVIPDQSLVGGTNSGRCVVTNDGERIIIVNPVDSPARRNFTIAHELGHAFLHGIGVHDRAGERLATYQEEEAQANRFAAALLMPSRQVREAVELGKSLEEMSRLFQVSQTAMRIRLERLGLLPGSAW